MSSADPERVGTEGAELLSHAETTWEACQLVEGDNRIMEGRSTLLFCF